MAVFPVISMSLGVLSLIFLGVGLFGQGWMVFDLSIQTNDLSLKENISIGLWAVSACVESPELTGSGAPICASVTMDKIYGAMGQSMNKAQSEALFGHFLPLQALMAIGCLSAVAGFVMLCIHIRSQFNKNIGIGAALACGLAGILVLAAVGSEGHQNTNMAHGMDVIRSLDNPELNGFNMEVKTPWAIIVAGVGAVLSLALGLVISLRLCNKREGNFFGEDVVGFSGKQMLI